MQVTGKVGNWLPGVVRGVVNSGIDAIPVVGLVKNGVEIARGKDFLPDKEEKRNGSNA